ncbi:hypothetical protein CspeluHIS016_0400100 [Cutaneotrichosporon spelunceum]|uniref:Voltage-dependent anion channel-domain-containing protein n=1 Tax=Cutaneotrichosporon spelunceum TaxID=1672016 RepID=A0AAD3TUJ2_9TREE|nr:hypothetical protein CspeluHIS016_0400100 [Cutaneotrichosporon spelunceum]
MTLASGSTLAGSPSDHPQAYFDACKDSASSVHSPNPTSLSPQSDTAHSSHITLPPSASTHDTGRDNPSGGAEPTPSRSRRVVDWMRSAALHTPPSFFSINMGCGMASILLYRFPFPAAWLRYLGIAVFVLNVVVFVLLLLATIARYLFYKGVWRAVANHNLAGLFWGTFPMGFVTIVTMICYVCVPAWGRRWAYIALGFWWVDVVLAVVVSLGMTFVMFTRQRQTAQTLGPQWLLPIVSCIVASASGGTVAEALMPYNPELSRGTLVVAYCMWGLGIPLAMMVIALLIFRFATGGAPRGQSLAAIFLPVGPCGQGSFGIAVMGIVARRLAYEHNTSIIPFLHGVDAHHLANGMYALGLVTAFVLWGLGLAWYVIGMAVFVDGVRRDPKLLGVGDFTISQWALTFPIGTFATSSIVLGTELHSTAFNVIGAFLATQVVLHWLYVSVFTVWKVVQGSLFSAPELNGASTRPRFGVGDMVARDLEAGYGEPESASVESVQLEERRMSLVPRRLSMRRMSLGPRDEIAPLEERHVSLVPRRLSMRRMSLGPRDESMPLEERHVSLLSRPLSAGRMSIGPRDEIAPLEERHISLLPRRLSMRRMSFGPREPHEAEGGRIEEPGENTGNSRDNAARQSQHGCIL